MSEHELHELVRTIDPQAFDAKVHGHGHRVLHAGRGKVTVYEPRLLNRMFGYGFGEQTHYFVTALSTPLRVAGWKFRWAEGTSPIALDLQATFEIQANADTQARGLVEALHGAQGPGQILFGLIQRSLHAALPRLQQRQEELLEQQRRSRPTVPPEVAETANMLSLFRSAPIGVGESEALNRIVSEEIATALGGAHFRIGFELKNMPPMQIEVRQEDPFTLADSKTPRHVLTSALLELSNYQAFQKSGLAGEKEIREAISETIRQSVKRLLFAGRYYGIVSSFSKGDDSIQNLMRRQIAADASRIGYRLNMFQTFPDIAALKLLEPLRIELPAADTKYYPAHSTGYVQMEVALSVEAEDFKRLHRLIHPDAPTVEAPILAQVRQICQDEIQKIGRKDFNLRFQDEIVPRLTRAIVEGLERDGLRAEVIKIVQAPTEEAARYQAIRGQTLEFRAWLTPQADGGHGDEVEMSGKIEVTDITESGWERFESKDFGFRRDSNWTESRLRREAEAREIPLPAASPMPEADRRAVAVLLELAEIRDRVVAVLSEALSKVPRLATHWSTLDGSMRIAEKARLLAQQAIEEEFGLSVALRGVGRADTATETTIGVRRKTEHELLREGATLDKTFELSKREKAGNAMLELLDDAAAREREALNDGTAELPSDIAQKIKREGKNWNDSKRVTWEGASQILAKHDAPAPTALPWEQKPEAGREPRRDGSG